MQRIYIVLLPFYKKDEVDKEIKAEWIFDCQGRKDLDYNLFVRILFRISHSWAVHVDYEEYSFLLNVLYDRVTCKVLVKSKTRTEIFPNIIVTFPEEERKLGKDKEEEEDEEVENSDEGAEWEE